MQTAQLAQQLAALSTGGGGGEPTSSAGWLASGEQQQQWARPGHLPRLREDAVLRSGYSSGSGHGYAHPPVSVVSKK